MAEHITFINRNKLQYSHTRISVLSFFILSTFLLYGIAAFGTTADTFVLNRAYGLNDPVKFVSEAWVGGAAIPGDSGAQLNVTIQNLNNYAIVVTTIEMNLSYPIENLTGGSVASSFIPGQIGPGDLGTATFVLNIASCASCTGQYSIPMAVSYSGNNQQSNQTLSVPLTITQPKKLSIVTSNWPHNGGFQGDRNDTLDIQVINSNSFNVNSLVGTIVYNYSVLSSASGNNATDFLSTPSVVGPGQTATLSFVVNVASDAPPGPAPVDIYLSYRDQWGTSLNTTSSLYIEIYGNPVVSIAQLSQSVQIIGTSTVSFFVRDVGATAMYSPSVSVNLPTGLTVTANFTKPSVIAEIVPGSGATFSFNVTAGKGISLGGYRGTLSVSYTNEFGTPNKATFTIAINVVGKIQLVVIRQQIVQTLTNITISGTILNYGTAPALATQVFAYLNETGSSSQGLGSAFTYIGTINPLTPSYFTITMSYPPQKSELATTITLRLVYENSTRITDSVANSTSFLLLPASQFAQPPGITQTALILVGLLSTIIITSVASFLYFRTRRTHNQNQEAEKPVESKT
jgi:hypothetical protein